MLSRNQSTKFKKNSFIIPLGLNNNKISTPETVNIPIPDNNNINNNDDHKIISDVLNNTEINIKDLLNNTSKLWTKKSNDWMNMNPFEIIHNTYSSALNIIETQIAQLIFRLAVSKSPLLAHIEEIYKSLKRFINIIHNLKINFNYNSSDQSLQINICDSRELVKSIQKLIVSGI